MWEKEISFVMEDPLGRDTLAAGLHKPEQPTRKYNGGHAVRGEERKLSLQHYRERGILQRDIKGSNVRIDKNGILKIADFRISNYCSPKQKQPLTKPSYDTLVSHPCQEVQKYTVKPTIVNWVEHLHRTFKLCGTPSQDYWKKLQLSTFRPPRTYKPGLFEAFRTFPEIALGLLTTTFLALDPISLLSSVELIPELIFLLQFFHRSPLACDLSGLPAILEVEDEPTQAEEPRK
ncbi:hypothetical protein POTOM_021719 [Populus tomentosa]|uniref:Protein kinase domain-containing protein n=1 Tax=Populus tomentosa TaxID=118781 RepID=A0A8X8CSR3_POPTO|nr:hypothetical protein POTOM_021719 [Populus tomentosa]